MAYENAAMTPADISAMIPKDKDMGFLILFILFLMMNGGWGGNQGSMQSGFNQSATSTALSNLSTQVGQGFANASTAALNGQMNAQQNLFGMQTAITGQMQAGQSATNQGMNGIVMGIQQAAAQNAQGIADLKYTVATENCADRTALQNGLKDLSAQATMNTNAIIQSQQQGFQSILDKMCALQIEQLKAENAQLRQQNSIAVLTASQLQQTGSIVNQVAPRPTPAFIVNNPYTAPTTTT